MGQSNSKFSFIASLLKHKKHSWNLIFEQKIYLKTTLFLNGDLLNEISSDFNDQMTEERNKRMNIYFDNIQKKVNSIHLVFYAILIGFILLLNIAIFLKTDFTFNWQKTGSLFIINSLILFLRKKIAYFFLKYVSVFI